MSRVNGKNPSRRAVKGEPTCNEAAKEARLKKAEEARLQAMESFIKKAAEKRKAEEDREADRARVARLALEDARRCVENRQKADREAKARSDAAQEAEAREAEAKAREAEARKAEIREKIEARRKEYQKILQDAENEDEYFYIAGRLRGTIGEALQRKESTAREEETSRKEMETSIEAILKEMKTQSF